MQTYLSKLTSTWSLDGPVDHVRFIVLDTETTGLDPKRDRLITIGAVAVRNGEIRLDDTFEALLKVAYNSSSVTVHGITRDEARDGLTEPDAVDRFLQYLQDGVIVGHHIGHDIQMLNGACLRHFGFTLRNQSLDTMDLTLHLKDDGAFENHTMPNGFSLDALCDMFGVTPHDRHTAGGDAFITARIFQRLLRAANRAGRHTLGSLLVPYETASS